MMPIDGQPEPVGYNLQQAQGRVGDEIGAVLSALQARNLLEPVILLSAGYLALPFLLKQLLLMATPLAALLGFVPPVQGEIDDRPY